MLWLVAALLFAAWFLTALLLGKGGFVHVLLLSAVTLGIVQFLHERRARRT
jgi:hypothetical protein